MSARMVVRPLSDICRADVKCQLASSRGPSAGPVRHVHRSANVTLLLRQLRSTGLMSGVSRFAQRVHPASSHP